MDLTIENKIPTLLKNASKNSLSYIEFRTLVSDLVEKNQTTGLEQSEALVNYTMLNDRRMKRWDKTIKLTPEVEEKIASISQKMTWLILTESWCGDASHILPVINKLANLNSNINYRVVLRDENPEFMDAFLTHGNKSIPKLIIADSSLEHVIDTYGPRPSSATALVNAYKTEHGKLTPQFKETLQQWYNKDKGQTIVADILNCFNL